MGWQRGPLPPNTWHWGGVVPINTEATGFYFADFHGDHVIINPGTPDAKKLTAEEVRWWNNSLDLPPTGFGRADPKGGA